MKKRDQCEAQAEQIARIVETARGREVRCPRHGHLLGVLNERGEIVIKCGRDEFVIVEVPKK